MSCRPSRLRVSLVLLAAFLVTACASAGKVPVYLPPLVSRYLLPVKDADWARRTAEAAAYGIADDQAKLVAINRAIATRIEHLPAHPGRLSDRELWELGNGWCDNVSRLFVTLAKAAGYPARVVTLKHSDNANGHVVAEAYYGGHWHLFDPDHEVQYYMPNGSVAGFEDLRRNPSIVVAANDPWRNEAGVGMEGFYRLPMVADQW